MAETPNLRAVGHKFLKGTYLNAGVPCCALCGEGSDYSMHQPEDTAAAMTDIESDHKCLDQCQVALVALIKALNMEPDSWEIADAILSVQNVVSRMRMECKYQMPDDDVYETPPITDAATVTLEAARYFSDEERQNLAKSGHALSDGSFPITSREDLKNAVQAIGRAKNPGAAKSHIKKMAKQLGATNMVPANWGSGSDSAAVEMLKEFIR